VVVTDGLVGKYLIGHSDAFPAHPSPLEAVAG
jgi:hypothetical protein